MEINETGGIDFEKMLEDSLNRNDSFSPGDKVTGKVVFISEENVFVDISGKSEAVIDLSEFRDDDKITVSTGDEIEGYIVSTSGGEIMLTTKLGKGGIKPELIEMAYHNSIPVFGTVIGSSKGGYTVSISGTRCFCPFSQIDIKSPDDPGDIINKSFEFRIIQYGERGKNIVLSRKALLEEERNDSIIRLKKSLKIGDIINGTIISIRDFGLFIDIGGIEGLVPKSEISWSRYGSTDEF